MASAIKAAGKVLDEALGIKSPSKKSAKNAVATNDDLPDGAAGGAGDHGVAGGVVPQRPEQMVPTESLIKARRLIFSKDFPSTAPTKTSKQLWEVEMDQCALERPSLSSMPVNAGIKCKQNALKPGNAS